MKHAPRGAISETPETLIAPLWSNVRRLTLTTRQYRAVRMHYPTDYLHMRGGHGCRLRHEAVGAGLYEVWLEELLG